MNIVHKVREFNRYYTNILGLLDRHILDSPFSLTEARVLFEIGNRNNCSARTLVQELNLDRGYLSRIINRFQKQKLIKRIKSNDDSRVFHLELTDKGLTVMNQLGESSDNQIENLLKAFSEEDKFMLSYHMDCIVRLLENKQASASIGIRHAKTGDLGYVIYRHGILYSQEYGFDSSFEEYVLQGLAKYVENYNPALDRIWVAEFNGCIAGSIAIVHVSPDTAQLRWFLVEPKFRNLGLGKRLVKEAIEFCKPRYKNIYLWTLSSLDSARYLYKSFGFNPVEESSHFIWGKHLTEEKWVLNNISA